MTNNETLQRKEQRNESERTEATGGLYFTPRVDILESEDELTLLADMPGVRPEDADIRFENGELIVHGRCPDRHAGKSFLNAEYGVGDFYRAFSISEVVDSSKIAAKLKNGVLTVHLPKAEAVKPRKIAVKGA